MRDGCRPILWEKLKTEIKSCMSVITYPKFLRISYYDGLSVLELALEIVSFPTTCDVIAPWQSRDLFPEISNKSQDFQWIIASYVLRNLIILKNMLNADQNSYSLFMF